MESESVFLLRISSIQRKLQSTQNFLLWRCKNVSFIKGVDIIEQIRNLKRLMEVAERIRQNEREVFLDFKNPQHDEYFCEQMGGISSLPKDFPDL